MTILSAKARAAFASEPFVFVRVQRLNEDRRNIVVAKPHRDGRERV